jgi:hypothetical protein
MQNTYIKSIEVKAKIFIRHAIGLAHVEDFGWIEIVLPLFLLLLSLFTCRSTCQLFKEIGYRAMHYIFHYKLN